ncbi:MAG: hypothetical protein JNM82_11000 [Rhodocyclaceae bacterium]|nr:hypothetical protein [Rhodocyclaceae bacterium]
MVGMNSVGTMVETLRLFDVNSAQIGGDVDLASVWGASTAMPNHLALSGHNPNGLGLAVTA